MNTRMDRNDFRAMAEVERAELMQTLRDAIYDYDDLRHLATMTGRSLSCLHSIRSGRTKWPRWDTIFPIAMECDLKMKLVER